MSAALVLAVYVLTFAVGFPANAFTLAVLVAKSRRRPGRRCGLAATLSAAELLLLNLTAADLLLLLVLPFKMAEAAAGMAWPLPAALCPVANFCFYASMYLSSLSLAALAVRRYLGVAFPLRLQGRRRPGRALAAVAAIWLLAGGHCSVVFVAEFAGRGEGTGAGDGRGGLGYQTGEGRGGTKGEPAGLVGPVDRQIDPVDRQIDPVDHRVGLGGHKVGLGGHNVDPVDLIDHKVDPVDHKVGLGHLKVDPIDPKVDPIDPKVDPVDLKLDHVDPNDPEVDPIDPKVDPVDHKLDLVDRNVDPVDLVDPVDHKVGLGHLKVDPVDPKVGPVDHKTFNRVDPRISNPKIPKILRNPKIPNPKFSKINPVDPNDSKTDPKIPQILKLIGPKPDPKIPKPPNSIDPKTDPKVPQTLKLTDPKPNPIDPKSDLSKTPNPIDPKTDPKMDPKIPQTLKLTDPKPNPIDPKTDPIDPNDPKPPKTDPKIPQTLKLTDPKTSPVDPNDPKPNPIDPRTDPKIPKTPNSIDLKPNPVDPKTNRSLSKAPNPTDPKPPNPTDPKPPNPTPKPPNPAPYRCYDDFSPEQLHYILPLRLEFFFVLFLVPFSVTVFCYVGLVRALLARPALPPAKRRRAAGLAVATMVIFGLCFAPYNVSHVVGFWQGRSPGWRVYATLLSGLNAALDPLVFYCSSGAVRQALGEAAAGLGAAWARWRGR